MFSQEVRATPVRAEGKNLTVSTVKVGFRRYSTVIFDNTPDRRNTEKRIGKYVIDADEVRTDTREEAMEAHREAVYTARTERIR